MNYFFKALLKIKEFLHFITLWIIAIFFFAFMTCCIINDFYFHKSAIDIFDFLRSEHLEVLFYAILIGGVLFTIQEFVNPRFFRNYGILRTTIIKSLLFFIIFCLLIFIVLQLNRTCFIKTDSFYVLHIEKMWIISFAIYCFVVYFHIALFQVFKIRMGESYFENMLRGNYMVPIVEYRIFMFLDMYSLTEASKEACHYNHSLLLQECFNDLSDLLPEYGAEVYQYIGDDAVLTWKVNEGFERQHCINLIKNYSCKLQQKKELYLDKFKLVPKFKVSINEGLVTVAEIGRIKTQIAYHGYALSTAARVRDLCKSFQADLLVTNSFYDQLSISDQENFVLAGSTTVRDKKNPVKIYMAINSILFLISYFLGFNSFIIH